jgi:hypothetical protein
MSNKKQTPVRWVYNHLEFNEFDDISGIENIFHIALQMESKKQQKYDEMLAMLEDILESWEVGNFENEQFVFVKQLIKEAKENEQ